MPIAIQSSQLTKKYGKRMGVEGLTFGVEEGSVFGFLGPNGSGKTTTMRVLLGFLRPDEGSVRVLGRDAWSDGTAIRRDVGYVPGDLRLYPWLTLNRGLRFSGSIRGRDLTRAGLELADHFSLDPSLRANVLSRGNRQKLGLILALAHRPRLVLLDEPTTALDPLMQERLYEHLRALSAEGRTIFLSSHSLNEVERLCDHAAILREGKLAALDSLTSLRSRAGRSVFIRFARGGANPPDAAPPFLSMVERDDFTWQATFSGSVSPLLAWAASQPIEDLSIGEPDLDRVFRGFYK